MLLKIILDLKGTSRIEIISLGFKAVQIVRLLADLKLKIVDVLDVILPQTFTLLLHVSR